MSAVVFLVFGIHRTVIVPVFGVVLIIIVFSFVFGVVPVIVFSFVFRIVLVIVFLFVFRILIVLIFCHDKYSFSFWYYYF